MALSIWNFQRAEGPALLMSARMVPMPWQRSQVSREALRQASRFELTICLPCVTDDDGIYVSAPSTAGQSFTGGEKIVTNAPGPPSQASLPAVRRAILAALRPVMRLRCPNCSAPIKLYQLE